MEITKINFAYFSPTLSTRRLIMNVVLGLGLRVPTVTIDLTSPSQRKNIYNFGQSELLIVAAPTYGGRLPTVEPSIIENFSGNSTPAIAIVVYGERGYDDTLLEFTDLLKQKNFLPISAATFVAQHAYSSNVGTGRPNKSDINFATKFGTKTKEKIDAINAVGIAPGIAVALPGNFPYKTNPPAPPIAPDTNEKCVLCMQCYRWCPTSAIEYNNPKKTDVSACIRCQGCVKRCPTNARVINNEGFIAKVKQFEDSFKDLNNKPEMFF